MRQFPAKWAASFGGEFYISFAVRELRELYMVVGMIGRLFVPVELIGGAFV